MRTAGSKAGSSAGTPHSSKVNPLRAVAPISPPPPAPCPLRKSTPRSMASLMSLLAARAVGINSARRQSVTPPALVPYLINSYPQRGWRRDRACLFEHSRGSEESQEVFGKITLGALQPLDRQAMRA